MCLFVSSYDGDAALTAWDSCPWLFVHAATGLPSKGLHPSQHPHALWALEWCSKQAQKWNKTDTCPKGSLQVLA